MGIQTIAKTKIPICNCQLKPFKKSKFLVKKRPIKNNARKNAVKTKLKIINFTLWDLKLKYLFNVSLVEIDWSLSFLKYWKWNFLFLLIIIINYK